MKVPEEIALLKSAGDDDDDDDDGDDGLLSLFIVLYNKVRRGCYYKSKRNS